MAHKVEIFPQSPLQYQYTVSTFAWDAICLGCEILLMRRCSSRSLCFGSSSSSAKGRPQFASFRWPKKKCGSRRVLNWGLWPGWWRTNSRWG